jgi:hypothetical protein
MKALRKSEKKKKKVFFIFHAFQPNNKNIFSKASMTLSRLVVRLSIINKDVA